MKKLLFILILFVSVSSVGQTLESDSSEKSNQELERDFDNVNVPDSFKNKKFGSNNNPADSMIQIDRKLHEEVFRYTFNQNKKVFQWQYISSIMIFFMVSLIVLIGLLLSYLQFRKAADTNTKLEIGNAGIKIDTAVIGLVILTLSLSFLFLYLKYVYPISIVKIQ